MSTRKAFSDYLSKSQKIESGQVIRVGADTILTSTPNGVKEFAVGSTVGIRVNDRVRFKGDLYLGRIKANPQSKVYTV
jgi:hypothetical protein